MSVSGLTGNPSRCCFRAPVSGPTSMRRGSAFPSFGKTKEQIKVPCLERCFWTGSAQGCKKLQTCLIKCATDASYGDVSNGSAAIFPRINVWDPYKRLGIRREASEEEIQAARNFLIQKYAGINQA